jgi:hypothetical protein
VFCVLSLSCLVLCCCLGPCLLLSLDVAKLLFHFICCGRGSCCFISSVVFVCLSASFRFFSVLSCVFVKSSSRTSQCYTVTLRLVFSGQLSVVYGVLAFVLSSILLNGLGWFFFDILGLLLNVSVVLDCLGCVLGLSRVSWLFRYPNPNPNPNPNPCPNPQP